MFQWKVLIPKEIRKNVLSLNNINDCVQNDWCQTDEAETYKL